VVQLNVATKDYWIYTNSPMDNERKRQAFERYGFKRGLEILSGERRTVDGEEIAPRMPSPVEQPFLKRTAL
jgi:hypothetical protein